MSAFVIQSQLCLHQLLRCLLVCFAQKLLSVHILIIETRYYQTRVYAWVIFYCAGRLTGSRIGAYFYLRAIFCPHVQHFKVDPYKGRKPFIFQNVSGCSYLLACLYFWVSGYFKFDLQKGRKPFIFQNVSCCSYLLTYRYFRTGVWLNVDHFISLMLLKVYMY